jgi:hypothetical protein
MLRKFYRTRFTVEVLSEEPIAEMSLEDVAYACNDGPCVAGCFESLQTEIDAKQAADALYEFGSDPGFFQLNADGVHEDDKEETES